LVFISYNYRDFSGGGGGEGGRAERLLGDPTGWAEDDCIGLTFCVMRTEGRALFGAAPLEATVAVGCSTGVYEHKKWLNDNWLNDQTIKWWNE
jgi:hypothetical protein